MELQTQTTKVEIFVESLLSSFVFISLCENIITYQLYLYDYLSLKFLYFDHFVINYSLILGIMGLFTL